MRSNHALACLAFIALTGCKKEPPPPVEFEAEARLHGAFLIVSINKPHDFEVAGVSGAKYVAGGQWLRVPFEKLPKGAKEIAINVKENNPVDEKYHRGAASKTVPIDASLTWSRAAKAGKPQGFKKKQPKKRPRRKTPPKGSFRVQSDALGEPLTWGFAENTRGFYLQNLQKGALFGKPLKVVNNQARVVVDLVQLMAKDPVTWVTQQQKFEPTERTFSFEVTDFGGKVVKPSVTFQGTAHYLGRAAKEQLMTWATAPAPKPHWTPTGKAVAITRFGDKGLSLAQARLAVTKDAKTVSDLAYVARLPLKGEQRKQGSCTFTGGSRPVYVADRELIVYELKSGKEVGRQTVKGRRRPCPSTISSSQRGILHSPTPTEVAGAAQALVAKL